MKLIISIFLLDEGKGQKVHLSNIYTRILAYAITWACLLFAIYNIRFDSYECHLPKQIGKCKIETNLLLEMAKLVQNYKPLSKTQTYFRLILISIHNAKKKEKRKRKIWLYETNFYQVIKDLQKANRVKFPVF